MNRLGEKSLRTLEYFTVLDLLAAEASSERGRELCLALRPVTDREEAELWLQQTTDAKDMMVKQGSPSLAGIRNVLGALKRADISGVLNLRELLDVASLLQCARLMQGYFAEQEGKTSLTPIYRLLTGNRSLEEHITSCIVSEEEIADGASPELSSIRRQKRQISGKVREVLGRMISGERAKYLQETIITQRNGRYVVPVKAEHRGDVPGLVHDTSSSGATVFVEPAAVVEINNQIKMLEGKEQMEIERILSELSSEVSMYAEGIRQDYEQLTVLDFIFARAKLSFKLNASAPHFKAEGYGVDLKRARHPLLDPKKAVPIDIAIGNEYDTLVITGPNTGGKTVSLKTLGLLCLMAASGLHIPASELSEVCVFENVYADIGDEQSIEQSLSTFSSHMKTIVGMMEKCAKGDLVLFDELGAGTDPVEGAALAVSVIGYARQMGAFVAATTHYSELKTFALTTEGVENASCEFDVGTLRPTYRLLTGIPVGVLSILINIPIFYLGWRHRLGTRRLILALCVMALISVLIDALALTGLVVTDEPMLGAVYGGVLNGAGYGLIYTTGTTGGGTDIVAKMLRRRYPYINFGTLLFGMNVVVVLTFAFLFKKYDSCMYTMIEMFISSKVVNLVLYGPGVSDVCYIITNNVGAIKSAITCTMGRGVTLLRGEGAWSGKEMQVILCVVKRPEIAQLREVVRSVDEHAFVIVSEAKEVFGRGFGNIYGDD